MLFHLTVVQACVGGACVPAVCVAAAWLPAGVHAGLRYTCVGGAPSHAHPTGRVLRSMVAGVTVRSRSADVFPEWLCRVTLLQVARAFPSSHIPASTWGDQSSSL